MINMKYYLILLISVFLALGIGTMVGISIQNKEILERQHSVLVNRLEEEFNDIREENKQLKGELDSLIEIDTKNRNLNRLMYDSIIKEKLKGLKVALIEVGDEDDYSWLISLLKMSGASIEAGITLNKELFQPDSIQKEEISKALGIEVWDNGIYRKMASELLNCFISGENTPSFDALKGLSMANSSIDIQGNCDTIILANNAHRDHKEDARENFCRNFTEIAGDYSISLILVEKEDAKAVDIDWYKNMGISTIHHVDTLYGKLTLVSLLRGGNGNYGFRDGAEGPLPDILFPEETELGETMTTDDEDL